MTIYKQNQQCKILVPGNVIIVLLSIAVSIYGLTNSKFETFEERLDKLDEKYDRKIDRIFTDVSSLKISVGKIEERFEKIE